MKYNIEILIKSILAGIMIGIGGTIYLSLDNKIDSFKKLMDDNDFRGIFSIVIDFEYS